MTAGVMDATVRRSALWQNATRRASKTHQRLRYLEEPQQELSENCQTIHDGRAGQVHNDGMHSCHWHMYLAGRKPAGANMVLRSYSCSVH